MALGEEFFRLQHLGALQMPDLGGEAFNRGRDHAERCKIHCVAVARDHLRRDRLRGQAHRLGDMLLHARIDLRKGADRARDCAGRNFLAGDRKPFAGAAEFRVGKSEFQAERDRLGVNAMRAADGRRHLVLEGAFLQRRQHSVDISNQEVRGAGQLNVEAGVEHIGGGHALVHEASFGADDFGQMGQEGDDVVLGLALDLVDPLDIERGVFGLGPNGFGGFFRDHPEFRLRVRRMRLDLEPDLETGLGLPDGGHFRAGIAGDHRGLRTSKAGDQAQTPGRLFFTPRFSRAAPARQTPARFLGPEPARARPARSQNID